MARDLGDFGAPADMRKDPITFQLNGETFTCVPEATAGVLNTLMAGVGVDERGNRVFSPPNLVKFVVDVLQESEEVPGEDGAMERKPTDDVDRFIRLINDKDRVVHVSQLGDLVLALAEEYGNRPG